MMKIIGNLCIKLSLLVASLLSVKRELKNDLRHPSSLALSPDESST